MSCRAMFREESAPLSVVGEFKCITRDGMACYLVPPAQLAHYLFSLYALMPGLPRQASRPYQCGLRHFVPLFHRRLHKVTH